MRKRHFLRHLYLKCIILLRQARDKHRERALKKEWRDERVSYVAAYSWAAAFDDARSTRETRFCPILLLETIILPRQALDKRRESSTQKKESGVSAGTQEMMGMSTPIWLTEFGFGLDTVSLLHAPA